MLPVEQLDTSRAHGQVYGENTHNIAFEQKALGLASWPYDAQGKLIEDALSEAQKKKLKERREIAAKQTKGAAPKKAAPVVNELEDGEKDGTEKDDGAEDDETNLLMWLKGEVRYPPFAIQAAIKKRFSVNQPKMHDAALYLVEEQKLLPRSQVHPSILPPLAQS